MREKHRTFLFFTNHGHDIGFRTRTISPVERLDVDLGRDGTLESDITSHCLNGEGRGSLWCQTDARDIFSLYHKIGRRHYSTDTIWASETHYSTGITVQTPYGEARD